MKIIYSLSTGEILLAVKNHNLYFADVDGLDMAQIGIENVNEDDVNRTLLLDFYRNFGKTDINDQGKYYYNFNLGRLAKRQNWEEYVDPPDDPEAINIPPYTGEDP